MRKTMLFLLSILCFTAGSAWAEKTFAVLPFTVHGPQEYHYLSHGIQSMLGSRLASAASLSSKSAADVRRIAPKPIRDVETARKVLAALDTDYLLFGDMTVMGKTCSLDIKTLDKEGQTSAYPLQTNLDDLIANLEGTAGTIRGNLLGETKAASSTKPVARPASEAIIFNETDKDSAYSNPSLKYENMDANQGRWRSQRFPYSSRGMVVCDADGDGHNEIFILSDSTLYAYKMVGNEMRQITTLDLPPRRNYLRLSSLDMNRDGRANLIISAVMEKDPASLILSFTQDTLRIETDHIPYHLGVVQLPPTFSPTLVGQKTGKVKYLESSIHQVIKMQEKYTLGPMIKLPMGGTVFNCSFLPTADGYQTIMIDARDHMRVYSQAGALLTTSEETYAGSNLGIDYHDTMFGLQDPNPAEIPPDRIFIPLRTISCNLDGDSRTELILSRNISVSAQIFSNYRDYPQGEIHCMYWDGVGMSLQWKTARIKGTVTDYTLADFNNDGILDLVVSMNTHTGLVGTKQKRTLLLAYPLQDVSQKN